MPDDQPIIHTLLLNSDSRDAAIDAILCYLVEIGEVGLESVAELRKAIDQRETLGSTATGRGVAIPHARHEESSTVLTLALLKTPGNDWQSLDGEPVDLIFLILFPRGESRSLKDYFERLWRNLERQSGDALRQSITPQELADSLRALTDSKPWSDADDRQHT